MNLCKKRSRRGLVEPVTGAIMLTATSLLGTMVVLWSNEDLVLRQSALVDQYVISSNKMKESIIFENIDFGSPGQGYPATVTLNNVGVITLNITEAKIYDETGQKLFTESYTTTQLTSGDSVELVYNGPFVKSSTFDIIIKTERGNIYRAQETVK